MLRWCRTLEYWYIELWNRKFPFSPIKDPTPYLGRGTPPNFRRVPLKKEGNKNAFGKIDFGSSETMACRAALLAQRIVSAVLVSNPKQYWVNRLRDFLYVFHGEVTPFFRASDRVPELY